MRLAFVDTACKASHSFALEGDSEGSALYVQFFFCWRFSGESSRRGTLNHVVGA